MLALVCVMGGVARARAMGASAASSSVVVVTSTADKVNGNVSSIAALNRKPGRHGVSLREALTAANHTPGSQTVYVMFSRALNGRTIELRSPLPPIRRNHLVLEGIAPNGSPAAVTIDGRGVRGVGNEYLPRDGGEYALLVVDASEVTVRWLRFTGVNPNPGNPPNWATAMAVGPGWEIAQGSSRGPMTVADVRVEDVVFDERGFTFPFTGSSANGLIVGSSGLLTGIRTQVSNVTIARNSFLHYAGNDDALGVGGTLGETNSAFTIENNTFEQNMFSIEPGGGERIIGNTITSTISSARGSPPIGIALDTNVRADDTLIDDNAISVVNGGAINLSATSTPRGGGAISNTQIVNNVITGGYGSNSAIYVSSGGGTTSTFPSSVTGVTIENDTLVDDGNGTLLSLIPNGTGARGNRITGVIVRNTIMYAPNGMPIANGNFNQAPDEVTNSLIWGPTWAGGNTTANPNFVNEPAGDYQLAAGSPAINAGTTIGAPAYDILGAQRRSPPDIGAYEYDALPRPLLAVTLEQLGGSGTITSDPAGISCDTTCDAQFDPGTTVTLTAEPDSRSRFLGWSGACSGKARCTINLNSATSVTARLGP